MTTRVSVRVVVAALAMLIAQIGATAQTTKPADGQLDFGAEGLIFPPAQVVNGHTPRTAQLLGEAYARHEPVVWKRVEDVSELGQTGLPAATPFLIEAMKDPAAEVRAEAARGAAAVGDRSLLPAVEKLLTDADPRVRREAVLSAAALAHKQGGSTAAIERGLADSDPSVAAAAIEAAWTPQDARSIAAKLPNLSRELQVSAAAALGRLQAAEQAPAVLKLLDGHVVQRAAAVRALREMGVAAQAPAALRMLADPHPTVRREAVAAVGKLADGATAQANAIQMLADPDPTVRQAAAAVLTPAPSVEAVAVLAAQLGQNYAPLHSAAREALARAAHPAVRQATIRLAAELLAGSDPRRQEDASFLLGRLRSDESIDRHLALLRWDEKNSAATDWPAAAQAAESLGLIGDARAVPLLVTLVKSAPEASATLQRPPRDQMAQAMANAMVALARLRQPAALPEAARILEMDPGGCPRSLRAASAFAVGVLAPPGGAAPQADKMLEIYASNEEDKSTKFEALKALGNLRHAPAAERLKEIAEREPAPDLRWIAHWSYQRASGVQVPYTPPTERREPVVSVSDLPR